MENLLLRYMDDRIREKEKLPSMKRHGPVVTISREAGCGANLIAESLHRMLKSRKAGPGDFPWRIVNKEIVQEAAKELEMDPERIEYVFKAQGRKLFDEILDALSNRYHKSDSQIRKTITGVIRSVVEDGYVVLVGRGGVAFTREVPHSVNILLQAPIEWRIEQICRRKGVDQAVAREFVRLTDKERRALVENFYGKPADDSIYDVVYNCARLTPDQIAASITSLMELKGLL